jgi:hypothetical protein
MVLIYFSILLVYFTLFQLSPYSILRRTTRESYKSWNLVKNEEVATIAKKQLVNKKRVCPTKEKVEKRKRIDKNVVIEVGEYGEEEEDMARIK